MNFRIGEEKKKTLEIRRSKGCVVLIVQSYGRFAEHYPMTQEEAKLVAGEIQKVNAQIEEIKAKRGG